MSKSNKDTTQKDQSLTGKLLQTKVFQDYQRAFEGATGLPLNLHEKGGVEGGLGLRPGGNEFCRLLAKSNETCAKCWEVQQKLEAQIGFEPLTLQCFAGLCESAIPVYVGKKVIAYLQTGQVLLQRPDAGNFTRVAQELLSFGAGIDLRKAKEAWFASTVLKDSQYQAMLSLLHIFAGHLSECAHALSLEAQSEEPDSITKAKVVVHATLDDDISLASVAKAVNVSACYFSDLFHKSTGLTFTEYVTRVRVEKVKSRLANSQQAITTIAYETGFKSLSQFNRVFRRVCGTSPREYRYKLLEKSSTT